MLLYQEPEQYQKLFSYLNNVQTTCYNMKLILFPFSNCGLLTPIM